MSAAWTKRYANDAPQFHRAQNAPLTLLRPPGRPEMIVTCGPLAVSSRRRPMIRSGKLGILAHPPQEAQTVHTYVRGMAEIRTVTTLRRKRIEIISAIAQYEKRIAQARADLSHVNACIALFEVSGEPGAVRPY